MPRPLSIGARWALRYTAAVLVTLSLFSVYVYTRVERRIYQDAKLLLDLQVKEVVEELRHEPGDAKSLDAYLRQHIATGESRLDLGIAVFARDGSRWLERGSLEGRSLALPPELLSGQDGSVLHDAELGADQPHLVLAARTPEGFVQVAISRERFDRSVDHIRNIFLMALPILLLLTGGFGWLLARSSLRPIAQMTATARRISGARLDQTIPTTGSGDELDQLAATLNEMVVRIRESMDRMRQFSADAAHQLRTPLAALRSQIEVTLEKERTPEDYQHVLTGLLGEVEMLTDSVHSMLRLASSEAGIEPGQRVEVPLAALLDTVVGFFEPVAREHGVQLRKGEVPDVRVPGDPSWLHQLFANLLHNAVKYTPEGGCVEVDGRRLDGRGVVVRVRDTGVGVEAQEVPKIFERFHRVGARQEMPGAGLGLPIAREIARAHGGSIEVESREGQGSTFTVELPVVEPAPPGARRDERERPQSVTMR